MKYELKTNHVLFSQLEEKPPLWWRNLKSDPEVYIDIRKKNYINAYHNGGSILKLEYSGKYKAEIHKEYIPLKLKGNYFPYDFQGSDISLNVLEPIDLNNFDKDSLEIIKKRMRKFYPSHSEKGIQGKYVTLTKSKKNNTGFFIDTEMQYGQARIDLVWVDIKTRKIVFVELKTISDKRLEIDDYKDEQAIVDDALIMKNNQEPEKIDVQLKKYYDFAHKNKKRLIDYYNKVLCIKQRLGLLPAFVKENSLEDYELIEKPILLLGDCTQTWINGNAEKLNNQLQHIAFGCLYHGKTNWNFKIPDKSSGNVFRFEKA